MMNDEFLTSSLCSVALLGLLTVADGTKGHKRHAGVLCTRRRSAHAGGARRCARATQRARLFDSWKITCSISHTLYQRSVGMLGKNLRSKVFHCAKLRDGTRDSVLALKIHAVFFRFFRVFRGL